MADDTAAPYAAFTLLERQVLEEICTRNLVTDAQKAALSGARLIVRENTGHGFYTHFECARTDGPWPVKSPVAGPTAEMIDMGLTNSMGFSALAQERASRSPGGLPER